MSLAELTVEDFTGRVRDAFTLSVSGAEIKLVLSEVEELGRGQQRRAFSLCFLGPAQPILPQSTYRLDNAAMGTLEIFLVPLGPKDGGMIYEAVFT
jgi:hypothetical protein